MCTHHHRVRAAGCNNRSQRQATRTTISTRLVSPGGVFLDACRHQRTSATSSSVWRHRLVRSCCVSTAAAAARGLMNTGSNIVQGTASMDSLVDGRAETGEQWARSYAYRIVHCAMLKTTSMEDSADGKRCVFGETMPLQRGMHELRCSTSIWNACTTGTIQLISSVPGNDGGREWKKAYGEALGNHRGVGSCSDKAEVVHC